jgi:hypothetical protein
VIKPTWDQFTWKDPNGKQDVRYINFQFKTDEPDKKFLKCKVKNPDPQWPDAFDQVLAFYNEAKVKVRAHPEMKNKETFYRVHKMEAVK